MSFLAVEREPAPVLTVSALAASAFFMNALMSSADTAFSAASVSRTSAALTMIDSSSCLR